MLTDKVSNLQSSPLVYTSHFTPMTEYEPMLNISLQDIDEELTDLRNERQQLLNKVQIVEECMEELMQARRTLVIKNRW